MKMIITTTSYCREASTSQHGYSSYLLLHDKPPQNSAANQFLMLTDSYGSGIQAEHIGDGFFLFYNVRDFGWKELKAGGYNRLEMSYLICLVVKTSSATGQNTTCGLSLGPGLPIAWHLGSKSECLLRPKQKRPGHF